MDMLALSALKRGELFTRFCEHLHFVSFFQIGVAPNYFTS